MDVETLKVALTRLLPKGFQKQNLLDVLVTAAFGVNNFRNT